MKRMKQYSAKRKLVPLITALLIVLPIAAAAITSMCLMQRQRNIQAAYDLAENKAQKLQYSINERTMQTEILEALVVNHNGEIPDFERIARSMYDKDKNLRSIQLAPGGTVTHMYPVARNEQGAINIFDDPERKTEAEWARDTGQTTLAGPYELLQGGQGIVARNPIYIPDETGAEKFWGFSIIILNVPEIFDTSDLETLTKAHYNYRIWRNIPDQDATQSIYANTTADFDERVTANIELPNATWYLTICPKTGWVSLRTMVDNIIFILLLAIILVLAIKAHVGFIRERKELIEEINKDALTGAYNQRYLSGRINELEAQKQAFSVYCLDMNGFKEINDRYGHGEGDNVLIELAARIRECLEDKDVVARVGGDEFIVLMAGEQSDEFCEGMRRELLEHTSRPYELFDMTLVPQISIGYARYPQDSMSMEKVMWLADTRMYKEKRLAKEETQA